MNTSVKKLLNRLTASIKLKSGCILLLFVLLQLQSVAKASDDSTTVTVTWDMQSSELRDVLRLQDMEYFKVAFSDTSLRGKHFKLVSKEYRKGKAGEGT
ncbi:hypothetical protein GCM10028895_11470 [Pontibacter rugosus]